MTDIAERICEIIRQLPEAKAEEILDFAEFLKCREETAPDDFFAMAGIWEKRDIDQETVRRQAWPGRKA